MQKIVVKPIPEKLSDNVLNRVLGGVSFSLVRKFKEPEELDNMVKIINKPIAHK